MLVYHIVLLLHRHETIILSVQHHCMLSSFSPQPHNQPVYKCAGEARLLACTRSHGRCMDHGRGFKILHAPRAFYVQMKKILMHDAIHDCNLRKKNLLWIQITMTTRSESDMATTTHADMQHTVHVVGVASDCVQTLGVQLVIVDSD